MNIWDIKKLVTSEDPSFKNYSQESLGHMRHIVSTHWATKYLDMGTYVIHSLFVLIAFLLYVFELGSMLNENLLALAIFIHVLFGFGTIAVVVGSLIGSGVSFILNAVFCDLVLNPERIKLALTPLVETEKGCDEALNHIKFSLPKDYRDAVIAQGRELVALDLYIMENLAKEEIT